MSVPGQVILSEDAALTIMRFIGRCKSDAFYASDEERGEEAKAAERVLLGAAHNLDAGWHHRAAGSSVNYLLNFQS